MNRTARMLCYVAVGVALGTADAKQGIAQSSQKIPVIDGGAGQCALELTITGPDKKPVYDATVKVHISYGFAGARRLDLQAGTNSDGKVKFTGIPARIHHPPLEFIATKDQAQGSLEYDPATECDAKHDIALEDPKPAQSQ